MHQTPDDVWTPSRVKETLAEAISWARRHAGPVGPAPMRGSMPNFNPTLEDHLEEGWGIPEAAGDDEDWTKPIELPIDPKRADFLMASLTWVGIFLINDGHPVTGKMVSLWMAHSVSRNNRAFDAAIKREKVSRGHAYRLRDRGFSLIAQRLTAAGIPFERHER
ncbi:hypothetical protein [Paracoccus sp. KR1-242]|uniref:hypothetical protein n=1 Tax=Paracoccus sp. KR1-242 TaxID=3410028 RepID=UPI003C120E5D